MTIFCNKCGAENPDNSLFCQKCGAATAVNSVTPAQARVVEPSSPYAPPLVTVAGPVATADIYAGFWLRFVAAFLDGIIVGVVYWAIAFTVVGTAAFTGGEAAQGIAGIGLFIFSIVGTWLYSALMESSSKQATLGKMALGIKVTDEAGERIGFGRATGRHFAKMLSSITLCIGYLMAAWTRKRQGLHDMMASTLVVRRAATTAQIGSGADAPPVSGAAIAGIVAAACLILLIPVIGILAAIAIPTYQDYLTKAKLNQAIAIAEPAKDAVSQYYAKNETVPATLAEADFIPSTPVGANDASASKITVDQTTGIITVEMTFIPMVGKSLQFVPEAGDDKRLTWTCHSENIKQALLPINCRG